MNLPRCERLPCCLSKMSIVLLLIFCASAGAGSKGYFPSARPGQAIYGPTLYNEQNKQLGYGPRMDSFGPQNAGYGPGNNFPGFQNLPSFPSFQNPLARSGPQQTLDSYQNPFTQQETFKVKSSPPKGSQQQQQQQQQQHQKQQQQHQKQPLPAQYPSSLPSSASYFPPGPKSSSMTYSSSGSGSPGSPKIYRSYQSSSSNGGQRSSSSSSDSDKYADGDGYSDRNAAHDDGGSPTSKGAYNNKNQYNDGAGDQGSHRDRKNGGSKDSYKQSYSTSSSYDSRDPAAAKDNKTIPNPFGPNNNPNIFFPPNAKPFLPGAVAKPKLPASANPGSSTLFSSGGAASNRVDVLGFGKVLGTGPGSRNVGRVSSAGNAADVFHQPGGFLGRSGFPSFP